MPLAVGNPTGDVTVFIGYSASSGTFFFSDPTGAPTALVDKLTGRRGFNVSWQVFNRTGRTIFVTIDNFRKDGMANCPLGLPGNSVEAQQVIIDGFVSIPTAVIDDADLGGYTYDFSVSTVESDPGQVLDPELQIDE